jgi:hypothetical protein
MTETGIVILYRWRLRTGHEAQFKEAWSVVTRALIERGSLGSRLHVGNDGVWYAYAQWPSVEARTAAFAQPLGIDQAQRAMADAVLEHFPEIVLTPSVDHLISTPPVSRMRVARPTTDIERAITFWTQVVGLEILSRISNSRDSHDQERHRDCLSLRYEQQTRRETNTDRHRSPGNRHRHLATSPARCFACGVGNADRDATPNRWLNVTSDSICPAARATGVGSNAITVIGIRNPFPQLVVHGFSKKVCVTVVSRVFLGHVEKDPSQRWLLVVGEQPLGRPVDSPNGKKLIHGMTGRVTRCLPKGGSLGYCADGRTMGTSNHSTVGGLP